MVVISIGAVFVMKTGVRFSYVVCSQLYFRRRAIRIWMKE